MRLAVLVAFALVTAAPAAAAVRFVPPFEPSEYADRAAIGLVVVRDGLAEAGGGHDVVVARPAGGFKPDVRYPVALLGKRGLLTSDSTRLDGIVAARDLDDGELRVVAHDDPAGALETLEARIERNSRWRLPLTIALAAVLIGLALARPRWALRALLVALAANLWLSPLLAVAAGIAVLVLPLGWACAAILAAYLVSMGLDAETVALSPFGPSQSGRFYGINNLLETMLLAPALVGAAVLGRKGVLVGALALVTIGGNRFGADGGGLVVLAVAYLVLWLRMRDRPPSWRQAAGVLCSAVALALLLVGLDAVTGGSSHVTEAIGDGPGALLGDIGDRIELSVRRTVASLGATAVVLGSLAILAAVALRARQTPVLEAFLVGIAVSLVVNDTPGDVLGMGAAVAIALGRDAPGQASLSLRSMRRFALLLALLALSIGVAGCGGGEETGATPETIEGTLPEQTTTEAEAPEVEGDAEAGASVYTSAGCGGCHTLEAAGSSGSVGPNLDESKPDFALAFDRVKNGQGAMPSFEGQLDEQQIADVAQYVVESTS